MAIFSPQAKAVLSFSGIATAIGAATSILSSQEFVNNPQSVVLINSLILLGNIGGNILASEIQGVFGKFFGLFKKSKKISVSTIQNLVSQAIFQIISDNLSNSHNENDEKILRSIIANGQIDFNFEEILEEHYKELTKSQKIYRYFSSKPETFDNLTSETKAEAWKEILKWLAEEDARRGATHFADLSVETLNIISEKLYQDFPHVLRSVILNESANDSHTMKDLMLSFVGEISTLNKDILNILDTFSKKSEESFKHLSDKQTEQGKILDELIVSLKQITMLLQFPPKSQSVADIERVNSQFYDLDRHISQGFLKFNNDFQKLFEISNQNLAINLEVLQEVKIIREWTATKQLEGGKVRISIAKFLPFSMPSLNDYFTGRENVLEKIKAQLETLGKASLFGLHGLGKTQCVLKYAGLYQKDYAHILFINAAKGFFFNSMAKFQEIFALSWQNYSIPERELSDDEKKCFAVKDFLSNDAVWSQQNRRFLLIFDNVDEVEQIKSFVPQYNQGDILFTSNSKHIRNRAKLVEIEELEENDAKLLIYRRGIEELSAKFADIPAEKHEVLGEIARELAYLPVLLENAAVTIAEASLKFEKYLERLRQSPQIAIDKEHTDVDYQYKSARNGFAISFEYMTTANDESSGEKLAAEVVKEVLFACSILAPADIPEKLLQTYAEKLENHLSEAVSDETFWERVRTKLTRFDLLEYDIEKESFDMHRFVQFVIWNYFANQEISIIEKMLEAIDEIFPYSKHETKKECEIYTPHAIVLTEKAEKSNLSSEVTASIYDKIGRHLRETVKYQDSTVYFEKAINFYKNESEKEDINLATTLNELAIVYQSQGKYDEAVELYKESLLIDEKIIGKEHPNYATRLNNLANVYNSQGKYDEAVELYKPALLIGEKTIGKEHPDYATRLSNLGNVYQSQGKYKEAIELYKQALLIDEKTIGKEHPGYATRLNNLANVYNSQGKYDEAVELLKGALLIDEKTIGKEHPGYAIRLGNLGNVYNSQGKYDEAVELYKESLLIGEKTIGKKHPDYATRLNNLGNVYNSQGKYDEAVELYKESLLIGEKTIGKENPGYAIDLGNLAGVYEIQEKFIEALELYEEALKIFENTLLENHPYILQVRERVARCQEMLNIK